MITREPSVSGTFYPYNSRELGAVIKGFIDNASNIDIEGKIAGLICPHAGYTFSGQTAGSAFSYLFGKTYKTVVVIAPSHHAYFDGISVQLEGQFSTPLGDIEIDRRVTKKLGQVLNSVKWVESADRPEHSVEVEVPFLQYLLKDFKLVPILMGNQSMQMVKKLANALISISDENFLFVASSDLYHGNDYDECIRKVRSAVDLIKEFDWQGFHSLATAETDIACGYGPITTVMLTCKGLGATDIELTGITNSGDITGVRSPDRYVVGYSSFVIYQGKNRLAQDDKERLLEIARKSIENATSGNPLPDVESVSPLLRKKRGAFVTIKKGGRLRGCIGSIHPAKPLFETVNEMAREAAISDPRFQKLTTEELREIEIEISVLSPLKKIRDIEEIRVGSHGLYIMQGYYSGLLLPQVAQEYGWDRETFLKQVSIKAGLKENGWKESDLYIFSAEVFGEDIIKKLTTDSPC